MQLSSSKFSSQEAKYHYNPDNLILCKHIFLDLEVNLIKAEVAGKATLTLLCNSENLTEIKLQAGEMEILEVKQISKKLEFTHCDEELIITALKPLKRDQTVEITVTYKISNPTKGLYFVRPTKDFPEKELQVWSQGESHYSKYWFPCLDNPQQIHTTEVKVTVPAEFTAISNGKLILKEVNKTKAIFHWKQEKPHPVYLTALTIGQFVEIKDEYKKLPVNYYGPKNKEAELKLTAKNTPKMLAFFEKAFGVDYPWDKYYQIWIDEFNWGGMENTSCTFVTGDAVLNKRLQKDWLLPETLIAHELAHQWFGDLLVIEHWSDLWIKEGAATYSEQLWLEKSLGKDEFEYYRFNEWKSYFSEEYQRPVKTNQYPLNEDLYDNHSYTKAGIFYNTLRGLMGDADFFKCLQSLLQTYSHQNVNTYQFIDLFSKISGKNLQPYFQQYLLSKGHPNLEISYNYNATEKLAELKIVQKQAERDNLDSLFNLEMDVQFGYLKNQQTSYLPFKIKLCKQEETFYFKLDKPADLVLLDPENIFLKEVKLNYPGKILQNQLQFVPNLVSKLQALPQISKDNSLNSLQDLVKVFNLVEFWGLKVEIIKEISKFRLSQKQEILTGLLQKTTHSKVKEALYEALSEIKTLENFNFLVQQTTTEDESYFVEMAKYKALTSVAANLSTAEKEIVLEILEKVLTSSNSWGQVLEKGAVIALGFLQGSKVAFNLIKNSILNSQNLELRSRALISLARVAVSLPQKYQTETLEIYQQNLNDNYFLLEFRIVSGCLILKTAAAANLLANLQQTSVYEMVKSRAKEAKQAILKSLNPSDYLQQLVEKVEKLTSDNQILFGKLEKLEVLNKPKKKGK